MDTIWQVTARNPKNPNAKVNRKFDDTEPVPAEILNFPWPKEISAHWIWTKEDASKIKLLKEVTLDEKPLSAGILATCDNAFSLSVNGRLVARSSAWERPVKILQPDLFEAGKNLIEVDAEMFGGAQGFVGQIVLQYVNRQEVIETGADWLAQAPEKDWSQARIVKEYGEAPWNKVLHKKAIQDGKTGVEPPVRASLVANDFLMRSLGRPHRDQVVTSRPSSLTTLQAIDLANGDILSSTLSEGAKNLSRTQKQENIPAWLYQHALGRNPTPVEEKTLLAVTKNSPQQQGVEDLLWMVFMQPDFQIIR